MRQSWSARAYEKRDAAKIQAFRCTTTKDEWDTDVEHWICTSSVYWATDESHAEMDRRLLLLCNQRTLVGIVAHELRDAVAPGVDGGLVVRLLKCIAVARGWQGQAIGGAGKLSDVLLATALEDIEARPQAVPFVNALIHRDNHRSMALFARNGFISYGPTLGPYERFTLSKKRPSDDEPG